MYKNKSKLTERDRRVLSAFTVNELLEEFEERLKDYLLDNKRVMDLVPEIKREVKDVKMAISLMSKLKALVSKNFFIK